MVDKVDPSSDTWIWDSKKNEEKGRPLPYVNGKDEIAREFLWVINRDRIIFSLNISRKNPATL